MRDYFLDHHLDEICHYFAIAKDNSLQAVMWQVEAGTHHRTVYHCAINDIDKSKKQFSLYSTENRMFDLNEEHIFFYIPALKCIFKADKTNISAMKATFMLPEELKLLEDAADEKIQSGFQQDFSAENEKRVVVRALVKDIGNDHMVYDSKREKIDTIWAGKGPGQNLSDSDSKLFEAQLQISIDEEDVAFAEARVDPRARASNDRKLILIDNESNEYELPLFDLSRSGVAFVGQEANIFEVKQKIKIKAFDNKHFDIPLIVEVMNKRELAPGEGHKFGCRFLSQEEVDEL